MLKSNSLFLRLLFSFHHYNILSPLFLSIIWGENVESIDEFKKIKECKLDLWLLKVGRVSSNSNWLLIYLPRAAIEILKLKKGTKVLMLIDTKNKSLIIRPFSTLKEVEEK